MRHINATPTPACHSDSLFRDLSHTGTQQKEYWERHDSEAVAYSILTHNSKISFLNGIHDSSLSSWVVSLCIQCKLKEAGKKTPNERNIIIVPLARSHATQTPWAGPCQRRSAPKSGTFPTQNNVGLCTCPCPARPAAPKIYSCV